MSYAGADLSGCAFGNETLGGKFFYATLLIEHRDTEGNTGICTRYWMLLSCRNQLKFYVRDKCNVHFSQILLVHLFFIACIKPSVL